MKRFLFIGLLALLYAVFPAKCFAEEPIVPPEGTPEALVFGWINEARANPWAEAERLGMNVTELRNMVGEDVAAEWDQGLAPLAWDDRLEMAGAAHVQDMVDRLYYSHRSPEGFGALERIDASGYQPAFIGESMGAVAFSNVFPQEDAMRLIYEGLMIDALQQGDEGAPLLDPLLADAGVHLGGGGIFLDGSYYNVYILIIESGRQDAAPAGSAAFWGHVYEDVNGNGQYDPGEGVPGISLHISGWQLGFSPVALYSQEAASGTEGGFYLELPPSSYDLTILKDGNVLLDDIRISAENGGQAVHSDIQLIPGFSVQIPELQ